MAESVDEATFAARRDESGRLRIALYVNSPRNGRENLCNVFIEGDGDGLVGRRAWYTGPSDAARLNETVRRSRWQTETFAPVTRQLADGGPALVVDPAGHADVGPVPPGAVHVWLFGPVAVDGQRYGSLFFELTDPVRPGEGYRRFVLRGGAYDAGPDGLLPRFDGGVGPTYGERLRGMTPVPLPYAATRREWAAEPGSRRPAGYPVPRHVGVPRDGKFDTPRVLVP